MFRIGEFSKIAQTTIKQLRYYDEIGLFRPEHIDQFSGYRYYRAAQLPDLNRILAMKELGLTLDQIKRLLDDNVSADEIRGMLSLKKAQVEQELRQQVERLHHIEARLRQVEQEGQLTQDDIVIKAIAAQPYYSFRTVLAHAKDARRYILEMRKLLPRRVSKKKMGHFTAIMHSNAFVTENTDVEMGHLLNEAVIEPLQLSSGHQVSTRTLPSIEMAACVVRVGGPDKAVDSYAQAGLWLETNGYKMTQEPVREMFIVPPRPDRLEETVCEIQIPVMLAGTHLLS